MLKALDDLIESRIRDAQQRGEFDDLPGAGKPLVFDDDPLVPDEVRVAYRILKNAGLVPPEVDALRDLDAVLSAIVAAEEGGDGAEAARGARRQAALTMALETAGLGRVAAAAPEYRRRLLEKLGRRRG